MKRVTLLALMLLTSISLISFEFINPFQNKEDDEVEEEDPYEETPPERVKRAMLEVKAGYFYFTSSILRSIFNHGGAQFELSLSCPLSNHISLYVAGDYFDKGGHSLGLRNPTHLQIVPLNLGLQFFAPIRSWVNFYLIAGAQYSFVKIKNRGVCADSHNKTSHLGGFGELGVLFSRKHIVFDVFACYSYNKMGFHTSRSSLETHKVQFGGGYAGAAIGCRF